MSAHLQRAINGLMKQMSDLSARVEANVGRAVQSLEERDVNLARQVKQEDDIIDKMEIDIEEECLKIFALHQPVAVDLRYLVAVLKINNDLERIGDLAQNIAKHTLRILSFAEVAVIPDFDLPCLYGKVESMLKKSLDAIVNLQLETAHEILKSDDEVDALHRGMAQAVMNEVKQCPDRADLLIHYLHIVRHLERIADHATNIAEDVIYLISGEIVRHGGGEG